MRVGYRTCADRWMALNGITEGGTKRIRIPGAENRYSVSIESTGGETAINAPIFYPIRFRSESVRVTDI